MKRLEFANYLAEKRLFNLSLFFVKIQAQSIIALMDANNPLNRFQKILVIAAHPDDEILGCGGTMIKAIEKSHNLSVLYLTSGDSEQNTREKESASVCRYLKVNSYYFLRFHKSGMNLSSLNINKIIEMFKKTQPEMVFVNHEHDSDREHQAAYQLTAEAFWRYNLLANEEKKIKAFLLYEVHRPMDSYNLMEDISFEINQKMKALSFYKSQLRSSRIDIAIRGLNEYRGNLHSNIKYAEVFQVKRITSLLFP